MKDDDISGSKTKNIEGAVDWRGHPFGGGIFLNAHYAFYLEAGVSPMIVQWLGPVYLGASYEFTFGRYYGHDEKNSLETSINKNYYTGSLNVCGGTMVFMNNHGIGIGAHGGMRQMRIINVGRLVNDSYNSRSGEYENTKFQDGYHMEDWLFYYSFDFAGYTNLPLLKESNSKGHAGYVMSMELGLHTDNTPLVYGAFSFSLFL